MKIPDEIIKGFEPVVKLNLSIKERKHITDDYISLISSFHVVTRINTDGIEPLYTVLDCSNVMRDDISLKTISRDELLKNAHEHHDGFFRVPKTF